MTRINLVPPESLTDQHLIAEYRELPRCLKQPIDTSNAPEIYCLGKGHMKWAKKHSLFLVKRFKKICCEMERRKFIVNFSYENLFDLYNKQTKEENKNDYSPTEKDLKISEDRIKERLSKKKNFYRFYGKLL